MEVQTWQHLSGGGEALSTTDVRERESQRQQQPTGAQTEACVNMTQSQKQQSQRKAQPIH